MTLADTTDTTAGGATPLSNLMDRVDGADRAHFEAFLDRFCSSQVGVVANGGAPSGPNESTSTADHPITLANSQDQHGRSVVLCFADPPSFARRFGARFSAFLPGRKLMEIVLANPACYGIRVNSANREISVVIDRDTVQRVLAGKVRVPWWKRILRHRLW